MRSRAIYFHGTLFVLLLFLGTEATAQNPSSKPANQAHKPVATVDSGIDPGAITHGVYRNKTLALTCKIPQGWVLRTEEMNAHDAAKTSKDSVQPPEPTTGTGRVLLAAFSRPPEARGEDVNSSILIAAESTSSYPGLKDAAQYFGPLTEIARAQGFTVDEEPYEIAVGAKTLVRGDFHKDVGARVMRQSTLAMLVHGYAVSITVIAGTEDEVEELVDSLTFAPSGK